MNLRTYFCMIVVDRSSTMIENLIHVMRYVDEIIVVDGGSTDGSLEWLEHYPDIHVVYFPWCDSFADSRNQYLNKIAELRKPDEVSVYVRCDDDEFFSLPLLENLKETMKEAAVAGYNQVCVRAKDTFYDREGVVIFEEMADFWKPLLHFWEPGMRYVSPIHEALITPFGARQIKLDDENSRFYYEHRKRDKVIWPRGLRNFFIGGGGVPPQGDKQPLWLDFRSLIARHGNFPTYRHFESYLAKGNIAQEIKDWFINNRLYGLPSYDARYTEVREGFLTYFLWYHPEELPPELIEQDKHYLDYRSEIQKIHGVV